MVISTTVSDLNCLYLCHSTKWSTNERQAVRDCLMFRELGGTPILYCIKDSYVDTRATELGIERIYSKRKNINSWFDFSFYFYLKELIKKNNINIVHCYHIEYASTLSLGLGPYPDIPLIFSINRLMRARDKGFFKRLLFSRIDLLLTINRTIRYSLEDCLPMKGKKIHALGTGLKFEDNFTIKSLEDEWRFMCYVPAHTINIEHFVTLFNSLKPLENSLREFTMPVKKFKLFLTSKRNWSEFPLYADLLDLIQEKDLFEMVEFVQVEDVVSSMNDYHLSISIDAEENVSDYEILAAARLVPILVPRAGGRSDLLENFPGIGESYLPRDAREIKDKCLKILVNKAFYDQNLLYQRTKILEAHGHQYYRLRAKTLYENLVEVRKRLVQHR
ncbi:MAG: hypothetical protein ACOYL6_12510 [Bacteriovoracaceae bacterium]